MQEVINHELHRIVTTCYVHNSKGGFLIVQRAPHVDEKPNKWTAPGGGLTVNDYQSLPTENGTWSDVLEKAVAREVREETGLEIEDVKQVCNLAFIRGNGIPVLVIRFVAKLQSGQVNLDSSLANYAWVTPKEAAKYDLLPGVADGIMKAAKLIG
jgi:8-oxo-dGTP pyrophosphatase MutT (NUDIX family)